MSKRSMFAKSALAAVAGVMAISATATAQAQPYGGSYTSTYDSCQRQANERGVGGALLGGGLGAVMGSQVSASGHRTDGSVLGGIVGAIAGAAIGHKTAACNGYAPGYGSGGYASSGYAAPRARAYADVPPPPPPPPPRAAYNERGYDDSYAYGYGGRRDRYRGAQTVDADGCTIAESPVLMPDGRTQTRFVKVCLDRQGRYQVVD